MGLLLVTPISCGQRIAQTVGDNFSFDGQLQIEVLSSVDELLRVHSHLFQQVFEQPTQIKSVMNLVMIKNRLIFSPSEQESKKRTSKIKSLVAVVISVVQFSPTEGCQQKSMHHVTIQNTLKSEQI
jgi:hypothetical protein